MISIIYKWLQSKEQTNKQKLQADKRSQFNESCQNMHRIDSLKLNTFYCGGQMLE